MNKLIRTLSFRRNGILCSGACGLVALSVTFGAHFKTASLPTEAIVHASFTRDLSPSVLQPSIREDGKQIGNLGDSTRPLEQVTLGPTVGPARQELKEPFRLLLGTRSISVSNAAITVRWQKVLSGAADRHILLNCISSGDQFCASPRVVAIRNEIDRLRWAALDLKVRAVNEFVNSNFRYETDLAVYGQADHWATLREFLQEGRGDCEDFAIAKMWMLSALGVPRSTIRLVVLHDKVDRLDHAVLAVRHEGGVWILDNRIGVVRSDDEIRHYEPYYSLSAEGSSWVHATPSADAERIEPVATELSHNQAAGI